MVPVQFCGSYCISSKPLSLPELRVPASQQMNLSTALQQEAACQHRVLVGTVCLGMCQPRSNLGDEQAQLETSRWNVTSSHRGSLHDLGIVHMTYSWLGSIFSVTVVTYSKQHLFPVCLSAWRFLH